VRRLASRPFLKSVNKSGDSPATKFEFSGKPPVRDGLVEILWPVCGKSVAGHQAGICGGKEPGVPLSGTLW